MKEFSYQDLTTSTNNFSLDHLIGKGSHGHVYKATLTLISSSNDHNYKRTPTTKLVAIKKPSIQSASKLDNEIAILSSIKYSPNIVNLIGISHSPAGPHNNINLLVTEFMPNGSLHDLLHVSPTPPSLSRRILIIFQIADALLSLHESGIVHRDVKSENILLDRRNNAKLADFSLAVWVGEVNVPAAGTFGYLDPGYTEADKLSVKNDVFSFGVVVLEIVSGRRAVDVEREPASIVEWVRGMVGEGRVGEVGDGRVHGVRGWVVERVVRVAMKCVQKREERRPTMREVVGELRECWGGGGWRSWGWWWRRAWRRCRKRKMMATTTTKIVCKDHLVGDEEEGIC